jgi:integrase
MKGHLERRGKTTWKIVLELGEDAAGKRIRKTPTFHGTQRQAEAEMNRLLHQLQTGTFIVEDKVTVSEYLERWLADYAEHATAKRTYLRYKEIIDLHLVPALGRLKLKDLRPMHIQSYYSEALVSGRRDGTGGLSAQTVLHHHRVLRAALRRAVKWQVLAVNPADAVSPPKPERHEVTVLSQKEVAKLLKALEPTRLYVPAVIAITTGMREGEVLGLRWKDVDLEGARLQVRQTLQRAKNEVFFKTPKTGSGERLISLPPLTVKVLRRHKAEQNASRFSKGAAYQDHDLVLARDDGRPWHPGSFAAEWRRTTRDLEMPVKFHNLRHTHATLLLANGEHPKVVQERLGHSSIGITMDTYSHVMPNMQKEAADRLQGTLDAAFKEAAASK